MGRKHRKNPHNDCFVLTLPMKCQPWQRNKLNKIFFYTNRIKNLLISNRLKALHQMERTREWKYIQRHIQELYAQFDKLKGSLSEDQQAAWKKTFLQPWFDRKQAMLHTYGFSEYQFHALVKPWQHYYKRLIGAHVAQKAATDVWKKFEDYFFGEGKQIHFSRITEFKTISGKTNKANIRCIGNTLCIAGMELPLHPDEKDRYGYQTEALSRKILYCKVIRKAYPEGWRYFAQLVLEGPAPIKVIPETGELLHPIGCGPVGLDIGPQTLAYSAEASVGLLELADQIQRVHLDRRKLQRAMDRSRRATNPAFFKDDGTVIPINQLDPKLLTSKGKRNWVRSKRYQKMELLLRSLFRQERELREQQHHEMANRLLGIGNLFYIEEMNFLALAKKAKEAKQNEKGKYRSRKRFGKSIAHKAPALFVNILQQKVEHNGGTFHHVNTKEAKASQYNHLNKSYNKKSLSQRWNYMPDGQKLQRDLYSAFLLQYTNESLDGFDQALLEKNYMNFVSLHDREIQRIRGHRGPSSFGIAKT